MSVRHCTLALFSALLVSLVSSSGTWAQAAAGPVKVFILAGQSNMEGKAKVSLLEYQAGQPGTKDFFRHLRKDGRWAVRDDVWIKFLDRKGKLTVGFGSPGCIGPELEFGNTVGDHYDQQVLLIKTAWGGKSLYRDFRPPSSGFPPPEVLQKMLEDARKRKPETTLADIKQPFGAYYREMLKEVSDTLEHLADDFPDYRGQGYEISGFVWFQGWNDMINPEYTAAYTENMVNLIRDLRKDLKAPGLPVVIGQLGVDGVEAAPNPRRQQFKDAQAAVAELAELKGNVKVVRTDVFWDKAADAVFKKGWREHRDQWEKVGSDYPYHYLGSVKTYCQIGKALGDAMIELCQQRSQ
jgi:hypothetical protein